MEEGGKMESNVSSAVAFVEGGIQDACDDACSICLEDFCESDPSTVTNCIHEYHLQCILEWCQRSSQCPMCWQPIGLKDPASQELLDAVERERDIRLNAARNPTIFHHPALGDFELQHLHIGANETDLEERIIQHLAAAAAMGRAHRIARRDGHRGRMAAGRPQFVVFSTHPNASATSVSSSAARRVGEDDSVSTVGDAIPSETFSGTAEEASNQSPMITGQTDQVASMLAVPSVPASSRPDLSNNWSTVGQSTIASNNTAGPSDIQSLSETLKSRFNAVSMRYKESITKSTRGWKERFFSRNTSMAELGSELKREVNAGIATVSRMMERLDTREDPKSASSSISHGTEIPPTTQPNNIRITQHQTSVSPCVSSTSTSSAAASGPN